VAYLLGYYPGDSAWTQVSHVMSACAQGLSVLCRKGYYAAIKPRPETRHALRDAANGIWSGRDCNYAHVSSNPLEWFEQEVVVKLDTQRSICVHRRPVAANLDVAFVQLPMTPRYGRHQRPPGSSVVAESYSDAATQGGSTQTLDIDPKAEKLRVVVRDLATGTLGSVSVLFTTPKAAKQRLHRHPCRVNGSRSTRSS